MRFISEDLGTENQVLQKILREIVSFLNTDGGTVTLPPLRGPGGREFEPLGRLILERACGAIRPDISIYVHADMGKDDALRIEIEEGRRKPYYLEAEGIRPEGVFVRSSEGAVPATTYQIMDMIRATYGDTYEDMRSIFQNLTFDETADVFERGHAEFSAQVYPELGITDPNDGLYTNLGLLLSDQCEHTVRISVFRDPFNTVLEETAEFGGSVCHQYELASLRLEEYNHGRARFVSGERIEEPDYPHGALREALINAIVHRDYSFTGSILINVNESSIEFLSMGGLLSDLSAEDVKSGVSEARNRRLSAVFRRLAASGASALGIRRIFTLYSGAPVKPTIEVTAHSFGFVLPNLHTEAAGQRRQERREGGMASHSRNVLDEVSYARTKSSAQLEKEMHEAQQNRQGHAMQAATGAAAASAIGMNALRAYRGRRR